MVQFLTNILQRATCVITLNLPSRTSFSYGKTIVGTSRVRAELVGYFSSSDSFPAALGRESSSASIRFWEES